jgi:hypothetical protein
MSQPPDDHLKALWQGQDTETKVMCVDAIRTRAARFTLRKRLSLLFGFALIAFEVVMFGRYALILPNVGARIGMLAVLVGLGWTTARFSLGWPGKFPDAKASGGTLLEFHRTELQRQEVNFASMMVTVGPLLLAIVFSMALAVLNDPHRRWLNVTPVLALMAIWLVAVWFLSRRAERLRRKKLAELDATRIEE